MAEHGKQKSPRMFAYPSGAYASAEQSAVRDMLYVDPNRLVLTLTLTLLIFIINVFVTWSKIFLLKMAANPAETTAIRS